jgi:hypothetical protein
MIDAEKFSLSPAGKSLKEGNRWQLWIIFAINSLVLYGAVQANAITLGGLRVIFADAPKLIPVTSALVIATVLNGLLSTQLKERLVFLRWCNVLPGCRAFSDHATTDPRIDPAALTKIVGPNFPVDPLEQNRVWYRLYRMVESDPAVRQVHRDYLLLRDYTGFSALFIVVFGAVALYTVPSVRIALLYLALLVLQYLVARHSASNYGIRLVTTVLAVKAASQAIKPPSRRSKPPQKEPDVI